jgi:hypothetical protein
MEAGSVFTALYPPPLPPFDLKIRSIKDLGLDFGMAFSGVFGSAGVCRLGEWVDFGRGFAAELAFRGARPMRDSCLPSCTPPPGYLI